MSTLAMTTNVVVLDRTDSTNWNDEVKRHGKMRMRYGAAWAGTWGVYGNEGLRCHRWLGALRGRARIERERAKCYVARKENSTRLLLTCQAGLNTLPSHILRVAVLACELIGVSVLQLPKSFIKSPFWVRSDN